MRHHRIKNILGVHSFVTSSQVYVIIIMMEKNEEAWDWTHRYSTHGTTNPDRAEETLQGQTDREETNYF